ncbi:MAG: hypothetical protein K9J24_10050 [Bacteroidales bacterium]|nr:hypothetical protein [Bacteroidales bacterium]
MKSIQSFFNLVFDNRLISEQNLTFFTEDHLHKLVAKNISGKYEELIQDTSVLYYQYIAAVKTNNSAEMERQKQTLSVDDIIVELKEQVRRIEGFIRSMHSKKDHYYLELFPNGLSEYSRINKSNLESLITRILVFLKRNPETCTKELKEGIIRIHKEYQKARESQIARKKKYKSSRTQKHEIRIELCKQLQKNLYLIAVENLGDPDVASEYFSQKLLREKRKSNWKNEELKRLGSFQLSAR